MPTLSVRRSDLVNETLSHFERTYCYKCEFNGTPHCLVDREKRPSLILCTGFLERQRVNTVARARTAAVARWGESRGPSVRIRVDADAAAALETVPEAERRAVASEAIRAAVDARGRV